MCIRDSSILLLDEIEKAHMDIYNILLQVMDNGSLTDSNGRKADFRNCIIVMTSNAGSQEGTRSSMGFVEQDHTSDRMGAIKKAFSPEFRNRLDAIVQFEALSLEIVNSVANKFIAQLQGHLDEKRVSLELSASARLWLAEHGYSQEQGARPMGRLIQNKIKKPLADEILLSLIHI